MEVLLVPSKARYHIIEYESTHQPSVSNQLVTHTHQKCVIAAGHTVKASKPVRFKLTISLITTRGILSTDGPVQMVDNRQHVQRQH